MTPQEAIDLCLSKKGAYLDYPFGSDSVIVKVGKTEERPGRIFAQVFPRQGMDWMTLNCDRETGELYRTLFPGIVTRGYHCPPVQQPYFNTFPLDGRVPDEMIREMAEHSYRTVVKKLTKRVREELGLGSSF